MKNNQLGYFTSSLFEHARRNPDAPTLASIAPHEAQIKEFVAPVALFNEPQPVYAVAAQLHEHEETGGVFERYVPRSISFPDARPHPTTLVESSALAALIPPMPSYRPILAPYLVDNGSVSEAQLEALALMGEAHSRYVDIPAERDPARSIPSRQGFMLGDGAGAGKGRILAAAIVDQRNHGNQIALWVSQTDHLYQSTLRDLKSLGATSALTKKLNTWKIEDGMDFQDGVIFSTYASLRRRKKVLDINGNHAKNEDGIPQYATRVDQLVRELGYDFSGLIIFDESQNLTRAVAGEDAFGGNSQSLQAQTAIELQERLPNARVVYASATALDRVEALAYAPRLGLWGPTTSFPSRGEFLSAMEVGRKTALEIVCRSLKENGLYVSRQVSYHGVSHETLVHQMTPKQLEHMRNFSVAWRAVTSGVEQAMQSIGAKDRPQDGAQIGRSKATKHVEHVHSKLETAKQRFYMQALTAMQMPTVLPFMRERLAEGESNVVQITNTYEAYLEKSLAEAAKNGSTDLAKLDRSCVAELVAFVRNDFPTQNVMLVTDDEGKNVEEFAIDELTGLPIENAAAVSIKQNVLRAIEDLIPVEAPLDTLLREFGEENMAEVTGRSQRILVAADGTPFLQKRGSNASAKEIKAFNNGKKRGLVFSSAGGVGEDYASNANYANKTRRNHYVLQVPPRAIDAMQGIGRTNRTNQVVPPRLIVCTTDYPAQIRFISPLARRIENLGSLTRGDRDAASGNAYRDIVDIEGPYAQKALRRILQEVNDGNLPGVDRYSLYEQTGIDVVAVLNAYLPKKYKNTQVATQHLTIKTFLNRMMTADVDEDGGVQGRIIDLLLETMNELIEDDKAAGVFDEGTQTLTPLSLQLGETHDLGEICETGRGVYVSRMTRHDKDALLSFDSAASMLRTHRNFHPEDRYSGWYGNANQQIALHLWDSQSKQFAVHSPDKPVSHRRPDKAHFERTAFRAESLWKQQIATHGDILSSEISVVHGKLLKVWKGLLETNDRPKAARMTTDDGQKYIGCILTAGETQTFINWLRSQRTAA